MKTNAALAVKAKDWKEIIEEVQEVLARAGAEAAERARTLHSLPSPSQSEEQVASWKQGLEFYEERMQSFQTCLQQAENELEKSEAALSEAQDGMREWIEAVGAIRKKLAEEGF
jgi:chromosome segregation ATPase